MTESRKRPNREQESEEFGGRYQPAVKRLKIGGSINEEMLYQSITELKADLKNELHDCKQELMNAQTQIQQLTTLIDQKLKSQKEDIIKQVSTDIKGRVLQTWKEGTDRFYNDAKSIVSDYSRSPSQISDNSRSRSASRDF